MGAIGSRRRFAVEGQPRLHQMHGPSLGLTRRAGSCWILASGVRVPAETAGLTVVRPRIGREMVPIGRIDARRATTRASGTSFGRTLHRMQRSDANRPNGGRIARGRSPAGPRSAIAPARSATGVRRPCNGPWADRCPRLTRGRSLLDCAHAAGSMQLTAMETRLGWFDTGERRKVAVVITTDGRRVHMPIEPAGLADVSILELLRSLPGLGSLLGLITGSRRDRGTGMDERR